MKCWRCEKEESNADVKINVERLISAAQEQFGREQSYAMACKKPCYKWSPEEKETYTRCDRERYVGSNGISDLCAVLTLDWRKLGTIARLARKWEQKRKWQYCFPAQENAKRILEWLAQPETNFGSEELSWIHQRINNKAEKATKKAA
jgi:hypothetical protein